MRVVHNVTWKYKDEADAAAKAELEKKLLSLAAPDEAGGQLGMIIAYIGRYSSPEGANKGYTHNLTMEFLTEKDRDDYLEHPRHKAVLNWLGENPIVEDFMAFDFVRPSTPRHIASLKAKHAETQAADEQKLGEVVCSTKPFEQFGIFQSQLPEGSTQPSLGETDETAQGTVGRCCIL